MTKELKSKIEAVLFCMPEGVDTKKLAKLCGMGSTGHVKGVLKEMQEYYDKEHRGVSLVYKDELWRFAVKDAHTSLVKEAAKPEIEKAVLETLAFIAYKKNARQSDVVKTRSNKAYDHIKQLESEGFIEAKKKGKTRMLSPTKKFYDYFSLKEGEDLNPDHVAE
jgi:segregation and condensation protein B